MIMTVVLLGSFLSYVVMTASLLRFGEWKGVLEVPDKRDFWYLTGCLSVVFTVVSDFQIFYLIRSLM